MIIHNMNADLQARDEGLIASLDDPVSKYVPAFKVISPPVADTRVSEGKADVGVLASRKGKVFAEYKKQHGSGNSNNNSKSKSRSKSKSNSKSNSSSSNSTISFRQLSTHLAGLRFVCTPFLPPPPPPYFGTFQRTPVAQQAFHERFRAIASTVHVM